MMRATQVRGQYRWSEPPADTVVLDFDDRHRRRMAMTGTSVHASEEQSVVKWVLRESSA